MDQEALDTVLEQGPCQPTKQLDMIISFKIKLYKKATIKYLSVYYIRLECWYSVSMAIGHQYCSITNFTPRMGATGNKPDRRVFIIVLSYLLIIPSAV